MGYESEVVRTEFHKLPAEIQLAWVRLSESLALMNKKLHLVDVTGSQILVRIDEQS